MQRQQLSDALKTAMKAKDVCRISTLRLILAALKDRDIAARSGDNPDGISDADIFAMLQTMIRQRREAIELYKRGKRDDLATQGAEEIAVIESYLPRQMSEDEVAAACTGMVGELQAAGLKDMGRVMATLKSRYPGGMDFAKASGVVKGLLSS